MDESLGIGSANGDWRRLYVKENEDVGAQGNGGIGSFPSL
jgi:hypothetical protein